MQTKTQNPPQRSALDEKSPPYHPQIPEAPDLKPNISHPSKPTLIAFRINSALREPLRDVTKTTYKQPSHAPPTYIYHYPKLAKYRMVPPDTSEIKEAE
ncbi:hypothetical protein BELL_0884g00030 [Botrytis elliptica]|uniref:Uncharacterized protein n=1 Tax=Botrytis elliptica TaxID=278938 RepID=A0A4Z1JEB8_9HELO|nr:hypothetical protein BELL_0884g00030 [Botrytis elliptica]